jgi:phosphoribosylformylglycinamidine synthase
LAKVIIMSGYGINCEAESAYAFELAGAKAEIVHINDLISGRKSMKDYDIMMFPGGFSYGDDTGSGNAYANKVRNNLWGDIKAFIKDKKLILGVCNGFQVMTHLGLFADKLGERIHAMEANTQNRYVCRWVHIKSISTDCVFTRGVEINHMPVAHGEGRFYCDNETLKMLENSAQIVFRYCNADGTEENSYPTNPNGSLNNIAGICDPTGRILGLMPHPERAIFSTSMPGFHLTKELALRRGQRVPLIVESNLKIFKNAVNEVKNAKTD